MTQRIALVTGAVGGLGTAICKSLAAAGVRVVGNFFPGDPAKDAWVEARKAEGLDIPVYGFDVSDYEQCKAAVEQIAAEVGPIDILVNNAGITRDKFFPKMEKGQWDAVIATNLTSLFNVTHSISPKMAERGFGRIINISSVNGVKGQAGQTNYSAAKAGVIGFSKALLPSWPPRALPSTPSLRATSAPTWSWRSRKKCVTPSSTPCRPSAWASPRKSALP